jgi:hypothetical protein
MARQTHQEMRAAMTPAQNSLYWREWGKTRARLISYGFTSQQAASKRHALHVKALGKDRSHASFTNADFDKVLGVFRAIHDDANLDAQLRQIEQPEHRREDLINRCWDATRVFIKGTDQSHKDYLCECYMEGVAQRVCKKSFRELDERELGKVRGILNLQARRVENKQRRAHAEKIVGEKRQAVKDDLPF